MEEPREHNQLRIDAFIDEAAYCDHANRCGDSSRDHESTLFGRCPSERNLREERKNKNGARDHQSNHEIQKVTHDEVVTLVQLQVNRSVVD